MYKLIGSRASRALRPLWMLEEIGAEYEHVPAKPRSPEAQAANPSGKVPAMLAEGGAITDSTAILTYLADRHGKLTHPAGSLARGQQDALMFRLLDEVEPLLWAAAKHSFIFPEELRVAEVKPAMIAEYQRVIPGIATALEGPFLMGEEMTVPDIILTHCLGWAERAGFPDPGEALTAYRARLEARPAFQRAAALP
ncbi:MAG: glutathione S-transferase family protein [Roseovarius sp.]